MKLNTDWSKVPKDVIEEIRKNKGFGESCNMGFTRYYTIKGKLESDKFESFSNSCRIVCQLISENWGDKWGPTTPSNWSYIGDPDGSGGNPIFTKDSVQFNGIGEGSHESFILDVNSSGFNFTKTQLKPYDKHVEACLILVKHYFGDKIEVSSDGDGEVDPEIEALVKESIRNQKISQILNNNSNI